MASEAEGSVTQFFRHLSEQDESAVRQLWDRFFPRLLGLARKTLSGRAQRVNDAEDAVQSAFFSFWNRAIRGDLGDVNNRDELWNLLGVITVRKALNQSKHEAAQKRGGGRVALASELAESFDGQTDATQLQNVYASMPTHEVDIIFEEMLLSLNDELRGIALLRLMEYQIAEIASLFECTERTIHRKIQLIKIKWQDDGSVRQDS